MHLTPENVADAYAFAATQHRTDKDKLGHPYIRHVVTVALSVCHLGYEYEIVGLLHDVVEDTNCTLDDIESKFGRVVRDGVDGMTKRPGEDYFDDYLPRVKRNPLSAAVKKADSTHNLSRVNQINDEAIRKKLRIKYERVLKELDVPDPPLSGREEKQLLELLKKYFGFDDFLEGQLDTITRLLDGKSVLCIFPTGAGKSLCYQFPAILLDGLTIVISPLIALMKDQVDYLRGKGIAAARLDSTLEPSEVKQIFEDLKAEKLKILYISPERLSNESFLRRLKRLNISLLAVDEAHCISQWGHNFRPEYLKIAMLAKELNIPRVLALTATATTKVADDVADSFGIVREDVIRSSFHRKNLYLQITPCDPVNKNETLLSRLRERPKGPTIIYVTLRRTAEKVATFLCQNEVKAWAYHAGLGNELRSEIQDEFMGSENGVIVATIAFGMGIDKSDIRYVYHYNLPKGLEGYSQEIGRAGRDGKPSTCEMLASKEDATVLENFVYGDTPSESAVESFVEDILDSDKEFDISMRELSDKYDIRELVVRTLLTYLELKGVIRAVRTFPSRHIFKTELDPADIIGMYSGRKKDIDSTIFDTAKKGRIWYTVNFDAIQDATGATRDEILDLLHEMNDSDLIELKESHMRAKYKLQDISYDSTELGNSLSQLFQKREKLEIDGIQKVLKFVEHEGCFTAFLLDHFGETLERCGHCSNCNDEDDDGLSGSFQRVVKPMGPEAPSILNSLKAERHDALAEPPKMTRFLCGLRSPAIIKTKLTNHPHFGMFEEIPFHVVLTFVQQHWD